MDDARDTLSPPPGISACRPREGLVAERSKWRAISEDIFGHELEEREKREAGAAVHYAFGTLTGGFYGAVAEYVPEVTVGAGLPFGAAFWLVGDEAVVPLLGLSKGPDEYPLSTHAYALASHLVYGLTEVTRRSVRNAL